MGSIMAFSDTYPIAIKIFPASNPGRQVEFHQIDRKTHNRVETIEI